MKRSSFLVVPFFYTYLTRLTNVRGLLDYIVRDVSIPVVPVIVLGGADPVSVAVLLAGFLALYEVGYILNDRSPSAAEAGGDRLKGEAPPFVLSIVVRVVLFLGVVWWGGSSVGWPIAKVYAAVSGGVLAVLLVHTLLLTRSVIARMFSFATLALSKYTPPIVPVLGWDQSATLLAAVFLMYGFPRTIYYVIRKMCPGWTSDRIRSFQEYSHGLGLFPGLIVVAPDLFALPERGWTMPALVWLLYAGAWGGVLAARRMKRFRDEQNGR